MMIEATHEIKAPRERVYAALIDPEILRHAIPGCESLEKVGSFFSEIHSRGKAWSSSAGALVLIGLLQADDFGEDGCCPHGQRHVGGGHEIDGGEPSTPSATRRRRTAATNICQGASARAVAAKRCERTKTIEIAQAAAAPISMA